MPGPIAKAMSIAHAPIYASRLRELVRLILPHLHANDSVLDVGCGAGTLGRALLDHPQSPRGLVVEGLERYRRGGEPITVHPYDGVTMPFQDESYDVVIVADVLHHEEQPDRLLGECRRVARRLVIIKDHQLKGPLARLRVSFIDWAANAPYGVRCLYRYNTPEQWKDVLERHRLVPVDIRSAINLYPPGFNLLFGRSLQYLAITARSGNAAPPAAGSAPQQANADRPEPVHAC